MRAGLGPRRSSVGSLLGTRKGSERKASRPGLSSSWFHLLPRLIRVMTVHATGHVSGVAVSSLRPGSFCTHSAVAHTNQWHACYFRIRHLCGRFAAAAILEQGRQASARVSSARASGGCPVVASTVERPCASVESARIGPSCGRFACGTFMCRCDADESGAVAARPAVRSECGEVGFGEPPARGVGRSMDCRGL